MQEMVLNINCSICNEAHTIIVDKYKYLSWKDGEGFIQDIMPEVSISDRELMISNICGKCFDEMFTEYVD